MASINTQNYVCRTTSGGKGPMKPCTRSWYFVPESCNIAVGVVRLPKGFEGKKIMFKLEVIEE
jgi:hypothetical protein